MSAHSEYCSAGDNTLQAIEKAVADVVKVITPAFALTCFVVVMVFGVIIMKPYLQNSLDFVC